LLVCSGLHRPLERSNELIQAVSVALQHGKVDRTHLIILAPGRTIPPELSRAFTIVPHQLPGRSELEEIARGVATEEGELPGQPGELARVLDSAAGLTASEAENAFALSIVRHACLEPAELWEAKSRVLADGTALRLHQGGGCFADLGGLSSLKDFAVASLRHDRPADTQPRGLLLLGVPGTGKSAFAKALAFEAQRPCLSFDLGALMGSLVGQTEEQTRRALATLDAMSPCICFLDEIEKALGASRGGQGTHEVNQRMRGALLTWMQDHTSDVYLVATSNDISALPPELTRAGRFDAVFFLDLPDQDQQSAIWQIHRERYQIATDDAAPDCRDWTGAEIEGCCRLARMMGLSLAEASDYVIPVAHTAAESVTALREWASGRCLDADLPGPYRRQRTAPGRRAIDRGRGARERGAGERHHATNETRPAELETIYYEYRRIEPTDRNAERNPRRPT